MKNLLILLVLVLWGCAVAEKEAAEKSGNPVIDGWYADPEVAIFDDRYWIFPTYSARFKNQVFFDAFSSGDLITWDKHERILDTAAVTWADSALWAPCVIKKDDQYFMFFGANDLQSPISRWWNAARHEGMTGGIGVAVADAPQGPYRDYLGQPLIKDFYHGAQPIDQFVFEDTDGQYYIIYGGWGHCNLGKLKPDFTALVPIDEQQVVKEITPEGYVEGPVMFRRNEWYYLMWSEGNWTNDTYRVAYGRSKSIAGPFAKIATILETDTAIATGAGHHSVLHIPDTDDWYMVYHRRPIPNEDRDHRVTCIDRMHFDDDGAIQPVKMTFDGVEERPLGKR